MTPLPHTPGPGRRRRLIDGFIIAVLLVAVGAPTSYYVQGKTYDERFAWRMFSGKRAERCAVQIVETRSVDGQQSRNTLRLTRIIHKAWESGLKRLRPDIVDRFFAKRCEEPGVERLELTRRCRLADGSPKPNDEVTHACPMRIRIP